MVLSPFRQHLLGVVAIVLLGADLLPSAFPVPAEAQVTPPVTSSGLNTQVSAPIPVTGGKTQYDITGGTRPGSGPNLFHSFGKFDVPTNNIANFLNDTNTPTTNILSRVTGGSPSNIFGTIQTTGFPGANLFLMNPAGVVFGSTAQLNVEGSLHVTTADYLRLTDGVRFTAVPGAQDALLSAAPVAAFGFLTSSPASVSVQGSTLQVPTGQTLSIIAGDIDINSADGTGTTFGAVLRAAHGQINLVSVAAPGEVIPNQPGFSPALDVGSFATLGTITESNSSNITVTGAPGSGTVVVRGGRLTVDNAEINANSTANVDGVPVGIDIRLTDDLVISNGGFLTAFTNFAGRAGNIQIVAGSAQTNTGSVQIMTDGYIFAGTAGTGKGPDIVINTGSVVALSGGAILSGTQGPSSSGRGGDINVTAGSVLLSAATNPSNFSGIEAYVGTGGTGRGGDVMVKANSLQILEGGLISTPTFAGGPGGNLTVNAKNIFISGSTNPNIFTGIFANSFGSGNDGHVTVTADSLTMTHHGTILANAISSGNASGATVNIKGLLDMRDRSSIGSTSILGTGNSGNLDISAKDIVIVGQATSKNPFSIGNFTGFSTAAGKGVGGHLHVTADTLSVSDQGSISAVAFSSGNAGSIDIEARTVSVTGGATISALTAGSGAGGEINITTQALILAGSASSGRPGSPFSGITSQSQAAGAGGTIRINANQVDIREGAYVDATTFGSGVGGDVHLSGDQIRLEGGTVTTSSFGTGNAGSIAVGATDSLIMTDSSVTTEARLADGGNISLRAGDMIHLTNSTVSSSVGNVDVRTTTGGNITIDPQFLVLQNSKILANAFAGTGGNINIVAGVFLVDPLSVIDASSAKGVSGTITIQSPLSSLSESLAPLPQAFLRTGTLLSSRCAARLGGPASSFVVAGRDAIPMEPGGLLPSPLYEPGPQISVSMSNGAAEVFPATALSAGFTTDLVQGCGS